MSVEYSKVGICQTVRIALNCDGTINTSMDPMWSCGNTVFEETDILTDGLDLNDPSGIPNMNCVEISIDPERDETELVETTCSVLDTRVDSLYGYSTEMVNGKGIKLCKAKSPCICQCGKESCKPSFALAYWSLAYCRGRNIRHPEGKYALTVYPRLRPRLNTNTRTTDANLNTRQYLSRLESNSAFGQGIQVSGEWLIPANEAPFECEKYEYLTDMCPPSSCNCNTCSAMTAAAAPVVASAPATGLVTV